MGYYDNPDRIMIGVDITTLTDVKSVKKLFK